MKILRIIARLNIGGPAINAILLTEGLDKTQFETLLICGNPGEFEGNMLGYAIEKNIKPYFIPELKRELNLFNDIAAFKKIYKLIKLEQPDIIHTHTAKAGALGRLAGILYNLLNFNKKIKLVHTFHGHIFNGYFSSFKTRVFILIERLLGLFTCRVITVSESVKNELIALGICQKDKIELIPLGLELDKFLDISIRDNHISNIGIVGRLVSIKNHRLFLDSAAKIIKGHPEIKLIFKIIGDGELREWLREYVHRYGMEAQVNFLGWQKDLVKVYTDLDIVALTSINEGTPVSLIEAMASGKAIVATDVGGIRDLLGAERDIGIKSNTKFKILERGIIVKSKDSSSFAEALVVLSQNRQLRQEMGIRGRDFVKRKFTKDRLIKDIENLYRRL